LIYFDNNATTPLAPEVLEAMLPYFNAHYGNAASRQHAFGWIAQDAVDVARNQCAQALHVDPQEIIFTSGATEACNLALKGVFETYRRKGRHIVTIATEHKAVLDTCHYLESLGAELTVLPVNNSGAVDLQFLSDSIRNDTILVSAMWANNETGVLHPMAAIGKICAEKGTLLFSDATQAVGKIPVHPRSSNVQLLACSAHKFHGPKGIGLLYISRKSPRVKVTPLLHGGGHEEGMRSGTLNVPGIVGMGKAITMAVSSPDSIEKVGALRNDLEASLLSIDASFINGAEPRMPHVCNIRFDGIDGAALMANLSRELAIASGSACTSANPEPSHVLLAMGLSREQARSSLRLSAGRQNTMQEVQQVVEMISKTVQQLRSESVQWNLSR
jgi:cysteine desulfurase